METNIFSSIIQKKKTPVPMRSVKGPPSPTFPPLPHCASNSDGEKVAYWSDPCSLNPGDGFCPCQITASTGINKGLPTNFMCPRSGKWKGMCVCPQLQPPAGLQFPAGGLVCA